MIVSVLGFHCANAFTGVISSDITIKTEYCLLFLVLHDHSLDLFGSAFASRMSVVILLQSYIFRDQMKT